MGQTSPPNHLTVIPNILLDPLRTYGAASAGWCHHAMMQHYEAKFATHALARITLGRMLDKWLAQSKYSKQNQQTQNATLLTSRTTSIESKVRPSYMFAKSKVNVNKTFADMFLRHPRRAKRINERRYNQKLKVKSFMDTEKQPVTGCKQSLNLVYIRC